jgi:hypothetical protein
MMHMSSSDVNPKTRFAGTHRPVKVRAGKSGSIAGQSASVAHRLAEPSSPRPGSGSKSAWATVRPGTLRQTPSTHVPCLPQSVGPAQARPSSGKCSSQPSLISFVIPLSWVH